jgi:predicted dehydrogenase
VQEQKSFCFFFGKQKKTLPNARPAAWQRRSTTGQVAINGDLVRSRPWRIALAGLGVIARNQHVPTITAHPNFSLAATIDNRPDGIARVPHFAKLAEAIEAVPDIEAVAICTPPQYRHGLARAALLAGRHVLLEKPPAASLGELRDLENLARQQRKTLFTAWHSRFAAAVEPARRLLSGRRLRHVQVTWREDVRDWHPAQDWIWQPGGAGVFDAGINALSILTRILPEHFWLQDAWLDIPTDCATPIAARLSFALENGGRMDAMFDWRGGNDARDIDILLADGAEIRLTEGGHRLLMGESIQELQLANEYRALYGRFLTLLPHGRCDIDDTPLLHVADALLRAQQTFVAPFGRGMDEKRVRI